MQDIYPCLWFDQNAHEAVAYYQSIFKDCKILNQTPFVVIFELHGKKMMALNGGPEFKFNEAVSLVISCQTQEEIDYYWEKLTQAGGEGGKCGWLKDKYGFSWQVVPAMLGKWMSDPNKAPKVMYAFMQMKKFDIAALEKAAEG